MGTKREFTYDSMDGKTKVHAIEWKPEGEEIAGVLQMVHGMTEYIDRYDAFARFLTEKGFVVVGHDHLGHGRTAASAEDYGYFHETDGNTMLLADIDRLRKLTQEQYPDAPYFVLGHSMGSFLIRQYLCIHGEGLAGAVVMGTGAQPMAILKLGQMVCKLQAKISGWRCRSKLVYGMAFGSYNKRFQPARTPYDWLTKDTEIVDAYAASEWCTFRFTLNGYYNLFRSIQQASLKENLEKMPKELPVLFVSGAKDPVGNFGKGVEQVRKQFEEAGMKDLTWILYEDDRHEILNETDREKVYQDIYAWLYVRMQDLIK
ncbi:MAG: alpha/beta fold hydrolase [Lachnospiraceae bacterium]|nr:alpha/beta fold hydrolase [Lachnospiraceae bacterium]